MKTIGRIEAEFNEKNECINSEYVDGSIVKFTSREVTVLKLLQDAIAGQTNWDIQKYMTPLSLPENEPMEDMFTIIRLFVEQKFCVNELKKQVDDLETVLMGFESEKK